MTTALRTTTKRPCRMIAALDAWTAKQREATKAKAEAIAAKIGRGPTFTLEFPLPADRDDLMYVLNAVAGKIGWYAERTQDYDPYKRAIRESFRFYDGTVATAVCNPPGMSSMSVTTRNRVVAEMLAPLCRG